MHRLGPRSVRDRGRGGISTFAAASPYIAPMSTDPRRFLYRPDGLDPDAALRLTADALKGCDDGELYLQYTASRELRLRRRPAEDRRFQHPGRASACAASPARPPPSPRPTRSARPRSAAPPRRWRCSIRPRARGPAPPRRTNARLYTDADPLSLIPFARKVALCQADRRRRPRPRSARRPGLGGARRARGA